MSEETTETVAAAKPKKKKKEPEAVTHVLARVNMSFDSWQRGDVAEFENTKRTKALLRNGNLERV